jgi:hypothetical protein
VTPFLQWWPHDDPMCHAILVKVFRCDPWPHQHWQLNILQQSWKFKKIIITLGKFTRSIDLLRAQEDREA